MFFSKVSGKIIPEIFEKSIDKHKIDAILESAVRSERSCEGLFFSVGGRGRRIPRKNPVYNHPDTESGKNSPGAFMSLRHGRGTAGGDFALWLGVFFEKC